MYTHERQLYGIVSFSSEDAVDEYAILSMTSNEELRSLNASIGAEDLQMNS